MKTENYGLPLKGDAGGWDGRLELRKENCTMDLAERSKKYIEYHMFETFDPFFLEKIQVFGFWHEAQGCLRYESLLEEEENGTQLSCLFPIFDPDSDKYDNYESP